jgi:protoporphyrinogen oxidase
VNMKIGIIGGGIAGLSLAAKLSNDPRTDIVLLEVKSNLGGIAHVKNINGKPFHICGGHCFNTKSNEVLEFLDQVGVKFKISDLRKRDARIQMDEDIEIPYPIELNLKNLMQRKPYLGIKCLLDLVLERARPESKTKNLHDYFVRQFGSCMANNYFIPYNQKIWGRSLNNLTSDWVSGKLPEVKIKDIIRSLFKIQQDNMIHQSFYYPQYTGGGHYIAERLEDFVRGCNNVTVVLNYNFGTIKRESRGISIDQEHFDLIVSTIPLKNLIPSLKGFPIDPKLSEQFPTNGLTSVLRSGAPKGATWTYLPSMQTKSHRLIHLSNFYNSQEKFSVQEAHGRVEQDIMKNDHLPDYIDSDVLGYNYTESAYPVYIENTVKSQSEVKRLLNNNMVYTAGRFGSHSYLNMDGTILDAIQVARQILK